MKTLKTFPQLHQAVTKKTIEPVLSKDPENSSASVEGAANSNQVNLKRRGNTHLAARTQG